MPIIFFFIKFGERILFHTKTKPSPSPHPEKLNGRSQSLNLFHIAVEKKHTSSLLSKSWLYICKNCERIWCQTCVVIATL